MQDSTWAEWSKDSTNRNPKSCKKVLLDIYRMFLLPEVLPGDSKMLTSTWILGSGELWELAVDFYIPLKIFVFFRSFLSQNHCCSVAFRTAAVPLLKGRVSLST